MRLRKQSRPTAQPGDEFLRAVSSGRERQPSTAAPWQPQADSSGLREQLMESERRGAAADEALRQIREERDQRLEQAREALARERAARVAAEQRLAEMLKTPAAEEAPEPELTLEPEPTPEPAGALEFPEEEAGQPEDLAPEDGQEEGWPAPWLEEEKPRRRGLFRRSRS